MNLKNKKELVSKTLKTGKNRIFFVKSRLDEIKEAITKQDIRSLYDDGAILIRQKSGRNRFKGKRKRKSSGNIRKKIKKRKREYLIITRKLRKSLREFCKTQKISPEQIKEIKKRIKNREFKNKSGFNEYLKTFNR